MGLKKPGGTAFKVSVAVAVVACIWIYNLAFNIPMFMWSDVVYAFWSGTLACYPEAANPNYLLAARIINFFVPLAITWTSYIGIIYKFKHTIIQAISQYSL